MENSFLTIIEMIADAKKKAESIWPNWPEDKVHAAAIVAEEAGELVQACNQYYNGEYSGKDKMIIGAIHTAVTSIRFLEHMDGAIEND